MNDIERGIATSAVLWVTTIAVGSHSASLAICVAGLWIASRVLPSLIHIFADFDAELPALTVLFLKVYSVLISFWFVTLFLLTAMFVADAWIFHRLFRHPATRVLAVLWYATVSLVLLLIAVLNAVAIFMPLSDLIGNLS